MKWFKRILVLIGLLLALAAALPFFISLNDYIPRIEREVSVKLKEPVTIKSIRFASLPTPHISVDGISIGTTEDIILGKIVVTPDIFSLLQSPIVIKSIEIDSPVITQKGIDKLTEWSKADAVPSPQEPAQYRVESIRLIRALINFDKKSFGPFDARINLNRNGKPENASITTPDDTLKIFIKPDQSNYLIDASAKKWTLPIGPQIELDELSIRGVATAKDVELSQISCKLYGGTVNGKILFSWQNGFKLSGNLNISQVEMQKIASMLSSKTHISGNLDAKPVVSASAGTADKMMIALHMETHFNVKNGVLYGVDIQQAATHLIKKGSS
ncbi:AsmA family protein, partial [Methylicorpusculum sp.]|uniref:AsmA family protein n=1 Tax=Methylicorpusculum sp. TaxID=2713644 RepID=UPI002ABAA331